MNSFISAKNIDIFPITNQRVAPHENAHYMKEPKLVKWLSSIADRKAFVLNGNFRLTSSGEGEPYTSAENMPLQLLLDGYYIELDAEELSSFISNNQQPEKVYTFLNIFHNYILGDVVQSNSSTTNTNEEYFTINCQIDNSALIKLEDITLSDLFNKDNSSGTTKANVSIRLNPQTKYKVTIKRGNETKQQGYLEVNPNITDSNSIQWLFAGTHTWSSDADTNKLTQIEVSTDIEYDSDTITIQAVYLNTEFQGLELSIESGTKPSIAFGTTPENDIKKSTELLLLTKTNDGNYIVPFMSQLKFEMRSVDGGTV